MYQKIVNNESFLKRSLWRSIEVNPPLFVQFESSKRKSINSLAFSSVESLVTSLAYNVNDLQNNENRRCRYEPTISTITIISSSHQNSYKYAFKPIDMFLPGSGARYLSMEFCGLASIFNRF